MTDYFWIKAQLERTISATYTVVNPVSRNPGNLLCPPIIVREDVLYDDTEVMEATDEEWEEERSKLFKDLKAKKSRVDELGDENAALREELGYMASRVESLLEESDKHEVHVQTLEVELEELRHQGLTTPKPAALGSSIATGDQFLKERLDIANATISRLIEAGKAMHKNIELTDAEYNSPLKASARVWKKRVDRIGGSLLVNTGGRDIRRAPEPRSEDEPAPDKDEVFRTGQVVTGVEGMPYGIWRLIARISFDTWICEHIDGDPNIPRGQQQRLDVEGADLVPDVVEARLNALSDWIERVSTDLANQDERVVDLELGQDEHDKRIRRIPRPGPSD